MKTNIYLISIFLTICTYSCDYSDSRLQVSNNSKQLIVIDFSEDTVLVKNTNDNIKSFINDAIHPSETLRKTMHGSINGWPFLIQRSKNNKLNVFFINVDTLLKYNNWKYIQKNKRYSRKEYTLDDLEKSKWLVEYP